MDVGSVAETESVVVALLEDAEYGYRISGSGAVSQGSGRQAKGQAAFSSDPARCHTGDAGHRQFVVEIAQRPGGGEHKGLCRTVPCGDPGTPFLQQEVVRLLVCLGRHPTGLAPDAHSGFAIGLVSIDSEDHPISPGGRRAFIAHRCLRWR